MSWIGRTKNNGYANKSENEQLKEYLGRPGGCGIGIHGFKMYPVIKNKGLFSRKRLLPVFPTLRA